MKAIVCQAPGDLCLENCPPPQKTEDEVLVRIRRIGICGTDFHIFAGTHPFLAYPRVMGHELSGTVDEAPAASGLARDESVIINPYVACGQCVACRAGKPNCCARVAVIGVHRDGGLCEQVSVPVANVYKAKGLSLDQAANTEFLAIGAHAVDRARISEVDRVLVVGAGPIGLGIMLFARLRGATVVAMDLREDRLATTHDIAGVQETIVAGAEAAERILSLTDGEGFDVVMDATGNKTSMESGFEAVAHGGRYVLVSVVKDTIRFADPLFHSREMTLIGSRNARQSDFETVIAALKAGQIPTDRLNTHHTKLDTLPEIFGHWLEPSSGVIKALVEVET